MTDIPDPAAPAPPAAPTAPGPAGDDALAGLTAEVAGLRSEFATALPHLVAALKRNDAVQDLTDRLTRAEKQLSQRRALPSLLGVARALHRVRQMDLPSDARDTLVQELGQILTEGGLDEFGAVGDPFDVARHEALHGAVGPDGGASVTAVHATGLAMGSLVVLAAKVSIAPSATSQEANR
ncbi:MAG: hypothetical protein GXY13_13430 [Acidimicrobiales bacterium]|nr:hypothetical protein [Acidimicrobiales bacterium]